MRIFITAPARMKHVAEGIARGLNNLNHPAQVFNTDVPGRKLRIAQYLINTPFRAVARHYFKEHCSGIKNRFVVQALRFNPDAVISFGCDFFYPEVLKKLSAKGPDHFVLWMIEDPCTTDFFDSFKIERFAEYSHIIASDSAWRFSLIFVGNKKIRYLPWAGNENIFQPLPLKKNIDVLFVTDLDPPHPFTSIKPLRVHIRDYLTRNGIRVETINERAPDRLLNERCNQARIVLYVNDGQCKTDPAQRVFDIALAGNFLIVDDRTNIPSLFNQGAETFVSPEDLLKKVNHYLANEKGREMRAEKARKAALEQHTFQKRAEEILAFITRA